VPILAQSKGHSFVAMPAKSRSPLWNDGCSHRGMTIRRFACLSVLSIALVTSATNAHADTDPLLPPPSAPLPAPNAPPPAPVAPVAPGAPPTAASSVRLTYESTRVDRAATAPPIATSPDDETLLHGFRLGYGYVMNYDKPAIAFDGKSLQQVAGLRSPHHFLLGYEAVYRVVGHSWLNVLLLGNAMVAGLEQSKFLPSANLLIGFELKNTFQVGVGANLSPLKGSEAHTIIAAGWTPRVGTIYTPVHFFFIPDVDGVHRMGVTTGVTF
jgi:hypothetical protein